MRLNDTCRSMGKKFYAGGTYGLLGYIFCDLQDHEFISPYVFRKRRLSDGLTAAISRDRSGKKDAKNLMLKSRFNSLGEALKWQWNLKVKREAKEVNPHLIFTLLGA